ncbi:unnamed protein product [Rotaria sp. Silwood2]|nr:unnamed protein product [Rotaria sp. Silwood2]CAF4117575.1 unnamed protein product [Rotaria sp. Silwood2]
MFYLIIPIILLIISYIVYKKHSKKSYCVSNIPEYDHAIIIGGSLEGITTAAYLSRYFKHKLLNDYGGRSYSLKDEARLVSSGTLLNQNLTKNLEWFCIDRFTLETVLRKELCLQFGNQIEWKCNARVVQLIVDQSANTVQGVKYRLKENVGSSLLDVYGDFIIDCTGRNTSSIKWLKDNFNLIVPTIQMHFGCGYVTFIGERFKVGDLSLDSKLIICSSPNTPHNNTGCYILPIREIKTNDENSLGILLTIALHCVNSEYAPNDSYENILEWAKENLESEYYTVLKSTKVCSPLIPYRRAIDDRKYVELLDKKWP